jgi:hypothetical protein
MRAKGCLALLLGLLVVVCSSCETDEAYSTAGEEGAPAMTSRRGTLYTRYNLHYIFDRGVNKGSYANWTDWPGHDFLPYNTALRAQPSGKRIRFVTDTGVDINFEIDPGRMGMSAREYVNLITSPTPVSYEGLSDIDQQGIEAGKAMVGMTKEGVKIALGYPAAHRTPSPDQNNAWTYWKGRHNTMVVEFDNSGKVGSIRD